MGLGPSQERSYIEGPLCVSTEEKGLLGFFFRHCSKIEKLHVGQVKLEMILKQVLLSADSEVNVQT